MEFDLIEKKYNIVDVLRKRKSDVQRVEQKVQEKIKKQKARKQPVSRDHVPAGEFVKSYRKRQQAYSNFKKRSVRVNRSISELPESKLIIAVRIRGVKDISPEQDKILKQLKLSGMMCAVFLNLDARTLRKLMKVENYITYGYPSKQVVSELIYKRAFGKIDGKRVHLNTNQIIEKHFESKGVICFEDVINQIFGCGEHFRDLTKFLWPFKLSQPYKDFDANKSNLPFVKGGNWGNREEKVSELILSMI